MGSSPVLHRRPTPQTPSDGFFLSSLGSGGFQSSFDPDRLRLIRNPAEFPDDLNIVSSLFRDSLETRPSAACTSCVIFIFSFVLRLGVLSGSLSQRIGAQICGFHAECWQPARLRKPPPKKPAMSSLETTVGYGVNFTLSILRLMPPNASSPPGWWDGRPAAEGAEPGEQQRLIGAYWGFNTTIQIFILLTSLLCKSNINLHRKQQNKKKSFK